MSTHNLCFNGEITEIIPKLSSNTLLICSTDTVFPGRLDSSDDSEVVSTTSYIPLPRGFESHWRQNKKINKPAGMYELLAVTFQVAVVSQDNSRQNC